MVVTTTIEHAATQDAAEKARARTLWLIEQWGLWARQGGENKSPRTPLMGLQAPTGGGADIDDDTAMAIDAAMCECAKYYPTGHAIIKAYYVKGCTNRRIQRNMRINRETLYRHKGNAVAYLTGLLMGLKE